MNSIATELNEALDKTVVGGLLSDLGRAMFFPRGIVAQSAQAAAEAYDLNATIGMAYAGGKPFTLPLLQDMFADLSTKELVAYAPTAGLPALRTAWQTSIRTKNPSLGDCELSLPIVVPGLTGGIFQVAELFVNEGDPVLLPDMFWGNYKLTIAERRGGELVHFALFNEEGGLNVLGLSEALRALWEAGKRKVIVLFNFPNNPTGFSPSSSEVEAVCEVLAEFAAAGMRILSLHDDAYFGLFYEDSCERESMFARCASLHENIFAVKIDGATKEEYVWGFRVGFMTFAARGLSAADFEPLVQKCMGSIRATVSNSSGIAQHILLRMLGSASYAREHEAARSMLRARYDRVRELVQGAPPKLLRPLPFNSGYFMAFAVHNISAEALRLALLAEGIGCVAIGDGILRIAFSAVDLEDLPRLYASVYRVANALYERVS